MNTKIAAFAALLLVTFVYQARTTEPETAVPITLESNAASQDKEKDPAKQPDNEKKTAPKKLADTPATDIFAATPPASGEVTLGFHPHMMGDFSGSFARQMITIFGTQTITTTTTTVNRGVAPPTTTITTNTVTTPITQTRTILVPAGSILGAFKIAENASPMPVDRVFFTYNFFGNLQAPGSGSTGPVNVNQSLGATNTQIPGKLITTAATANTFFPGTPLNVNLHREVFGVEKTFLDGFASVELRVPLLQQTSSLDGFSSRDIGDLTVVTKYAFLLDRQTGNVVSGGLAITAPTGRSIATIDGNIRSTLLQPWLGYLWNADRFFLHAFHSVVVPTDARDVTLLFNDVGLNYWLYRGEPNRPLRFVVPMVEAHVTTPLNQRGPDSAIYVPDLVVMTGGAHFGLGRNTTLSLGAATPVSGPRLFNVEAFMQLNMRY